MRGIWWLALAALLHSGDNMFTSVYNEYNDTVGNNNNLRFVSVGSMFTLLFCFLFSNCINQSIQQVYHVFFCILLF